MSKLKITLDHHNGYRTGETISGTVEWSHVLCKKEEPIKVSLIYYTKGTGARDVEIIERVLLPSKSEIATFSFVLKGYPASFIGSLISIQWAIEAYYPATKQSTITEFAVSSTGEVIKLPYIPLENKKKGTNFFHIFSFKGK